MKMLPENFRARLLPIALGQVIGMGCGVIGVKISSQLVAPADYGRYGLFLTLTPLGMWVVHAGLIKFTGRHWGGSAQRSGLLHEIVPAFLRKLPWLALAAAAVTLALTPVDRLAVFGLLFVATTFLSATAVVQAALQSARQHWPDCGIASVSSVTRTFLPLLLYYAVSGTALALYAGIGLHALLVAGVAALALRAHWQKPAVAAAPQITEVYDGPLFVILAVAGWIMGGLNRWIVAAFFGATTAGYFVLAGNLAMIVAALLGIIFIQYFQPGFFAAPTATGDDRRALARHVDRVALGYWGSALAGLTLLQVLAPRLVGGFINENYRPALPYVMPAGFFLTALLTGSFYHSMLLAAKRERACAPVDLSSYAVLALGCGLAPALGGETGLRWWLLAAPAVPWLLNRPLARHYLLTPA